MFVLKIISLMDAPVVLWNDFRKVVKFIDENPWVKPMLERIVKEKKQRDEIVSLATQSLSRHQIPQYLL